MRRIIMTFPCIVFLIFLIGCGAEVRQMETPDAVVLQEPEMTKSTDAPVEVQSESVQTATLDGEAQIIRLIETEYAILPAQVTAKPGLIRLITENKGRENHRIEIEGKTGGEQFRIERDVPKGQSVIIDMRVDRGIYEMYCPIPG